MPCFSVDSFRHSVLPTIFPPFSTVVVFFTIFIGAGFSYLYAPFLSSPVFILDLLIYRFWSLSSIFFLPFSLYSTSVELSTAAVSVWFTLVENVDSVTTAKSSGDSVNVRQSPTHSFTQLAYQCRNEYHPRENAVSSPGKRRGENALLPPGKRRGVFVNLQQHWHDLGLKNNLCIGTACASSNPYIGMLYLGKQLPTGNSRKCVAKIWFFQCSQK